MPLVLLLLLLGVEAVPLGEQGQPHNPVTEHLARSRHGQVPRIPETLFSFLQEGFLEEELEDDEEAEEVVKVKKNLIGGNSVNHNVDTYRSYSLPPGSVLLSNSQLTTSNPLDNLRDFHEEEREEEDQLAVESLEVTPRAVPAPVSTLTTEAPVSALTTEATLEPQHKVPAENLMQHSTQPQKQARGEHEQKEKAIDHQELIPRKTQEIVLTEQKLKEKLVLEKELEDVLEELEEMDLEEDGWVTSGPSQAETMQEQQEGEVGAPGPGRKEWQAAQGPGAEVAAVSEAGQEEVTDPGELAAGIQEQTGPEQQLPEISPEKNHTEMSQQNPSLESLQQENHIEDILEQDDKFQLVLQPENQYRQMPEQDNDSRKVLQQENRSQEIQHKENPSREILEQGSRTSELQGIEEGGSDPLYPGPGGSSPAHPQEVREQTDLLEDPPMQYPVLAGSPGVEQGETYPQYQDDYTYIEYYQGEAEFSKEQQEYLEENAYFDDQGSLEEIQKVTSEKPNDHTYPFALYGGDEEESGSDVYEMVTDYSYTADEVPSAVTEVVTTQATQEETEKVRVEEVEYEDVQEVAPSLASAPASTSSPAPAPTLAEAPAPVPANALALDPAPTPTLTSRPLLTLMTSEPNTMQLLVTPDRFEPETTVRLMYERVSRNRPPLLTQLTDPVVKTVLLSTASQHHSLYNLPVGDYIVCGEAHWRGRVIQSNCFQTVIERLDSNMLQSGVIAIIAVAALLVAATVGFAVWHRLVLAKRLKKERQLAEKVERFARKEAELAERGERVPVIYPDPSVPYEERCIM